MSFKLRCWHSLRYRTAKQGLHFSIKYPCFFFQRNLWRNVSFEGRHRQKVTLSVSSQLNAREDGLEAEPSPNRDQIPTVIYTAREIHIQVEKKIILTAWETSLFLLCHQSLFICSSASQVLLPPAFSYFPVAHLVTLELTHLSATSISQTPFIILICRFLSKGTSLSFWVPGLIYSSRNMYLSCITSTSHRSLISQACWRNSMGLPSKILNDAKLFPFHFPNSQYRINLQQRTIYSVYDWISKSTRDEYISSSQQHSRQRCFW